MLNDLNHPWSTYPLYVIKKGGEYHALWGESPEGKDVTGIPLFAARELAQQQIEADEIRGTIEAIGSLPVLKRLANELGDVWLFFFADEESEMTPIPASQFI